MPHTVTLADAKTHLEELVARARRGEESLITDASGQPIAKVAAASMVETTPEVPRKSGTRSYLD